MYRLTLCWVVNSKCFEVKRHPGQYFRTFFGPKIFFSRNVFCFNLNHSLFFLQLREQRAREVMNQACGTEEENHIKDLMEERKQKEEFRRSLQDQIIEKQRQHQEEFIEFMKEKKFFDEIIKKIKEDENKFVSIILTFKYFFFN